MDYSYQQQVDHQHLRWLAMSHYILSGFLFLASFFLMAYPVFMAWVLNQSAGAPPDETRSIIIVIAVMYGLFSLFALAAAGANIFAGRFLQRRRRKLFLLIMAGVNCLNVPLGTILGVFTFIVLLRPSVSAEFETMATSSAPPTLPHA